MKRKLILITGLFGLFLFTVVFFITSCKKTDSTGDTTFASDNAIAENTFSDVKNISDQAANGSLTTYVAQADKYDLLTTCATITLVTGKITIDFGANNCWCNDFRYRRGKIIVTYTGKYFDSNSVITITFDGYAVNDYLVAGTKTITNLGHNSKGHPISSTFVSSTITVPNGGGTIIWNCNRQNEWISGYNTPLIWTDDEYYITGTASGTTRNGVSYTLSVASTSPLWVKLSCHNIVGGILQISLPKSGQTATLDYGPGTSGNCDNQAVLTYLSKTYNITLP